MELLAWIACFLVFCFNIQGQGFSVLHTFTPGDTNGFFPRTSLVLSGNRLFGALAYGGSYGALGGNLDKGNGTIFGVNTDGTGFSVLHTFTSLNPVNGHNDDGSTPNGVTISGGMLYGSTFFGGTNAYGTLYGISTNGNGFTVIYNANSGGKGEFTTVGNTLYGSIDDELAAINSDGTGIITLHSGAADRVAISGNTLVGLRQVDQSYGNVFKINTNGTDFRTLHEFVNGSDGEYPTGIVVSDDMVYGVAGRGGVNGSGTIFKVKTDGTGFTILYSFSEVALDFGSDIYTNIDGNYPQGLVLLGNSLYGTANGGGTNGWGTVFSINTDGTGFTTLHNFNGIDAGGPFAGPIFSGNTLYGTTSGTVYFGPSGSIESGQSTVFSLKMGSKAPVRLSISSSGNAAVLHWPDSSFKLQSAPLLDRNFSDVPGANSPFTNKITGSSQFFRLIWN